MQTHDFFTREEQLLITAMSRCFDDLDFSNPHTLYGDALKRAVENGIRAPQFRDYGLYALEEARDRKRYQEWEEQNPVLIEKAVAFIEAKPINAFLSAAAIAACTVMALGIHFVTPFVWAVLV
jgi:hypothetical protein